MSIKARITAWYAAFLVLLVTLTLGFMFTVGSLQMRAASAATLETAVRSAAAELDYDSGIIGIDDDIDYAHLGVYISVYDLSGSLVAGRMPIDFEPVPLEPSANARLIRAEKDWYVYDCVQQVEGALTVWVRGVISITQVSSTSGTMLNLAFIALPMLVILAATGGYLITRRALMPVKRITETARRISSGNDLSKRIGLEAGRDEIHVLAATFDEMFIKLEDAFKKEKQFTDDASHELRTPVAVIISQSEYAKDHPEKSAQAFDAVLEQAKKMSSMISQLLMLARADRNALQLDMESIDLALTAEAVANEMESAAAKSGISILTGFCGDCRVQGDQLMLTRLMLNLTDNAVKYARAGGHVWINVQREDESVVCTVRDDGIGIESEKLQYIFERFYQADPSHSNKGSGLGLSMAHAIVTAHGGSITAASTFGAGTIIKIIFPVN